MIKEIRSDLFSIEVPLPKNPLKAVNSYIITGKDRNLIIDTAMNRPECRDVLFRGLEKLNIDLEKTDLFVTHFHADHFGLSGDIVKNGSKCYMGKKDRAYIVGESDWEYMQQFFIESGFPDDMVRDSMSRHPGYLYSPTKLVEITPVSDGDIIEAGDYRLQCIETPGHTPGHVCLYESSKKLFFSGDHILFDITPNISHWMSVKDSLRDYLASLEKVRELSVTMVLPGHRNSYHDHAERIDELKLHHRNRLDEIITALQGGDKTSYEIAPYITWKIEYREWKDFPIAQKWFAVSETLAHLDYLEHDGVIKKYKDNGMIYYHLL